MKSICYYQGKFMQSEECFLPVTDLVIQRGIGVFDSIRTYGRKPFALQQHLERLAASAAKCGIEAHDIIEGLPAVIKRGVELEETSDDDMVIRAYITGGSINNRGHFPEPRFFVIFEDAHKITSEELHDGVSLKPNYVERPLPEVKSVNYLLGYQPMASAAKTDFETLYIVNGEITEATASSFFMCLGGKIITAPVGKVLRGITREIILTIARENGFRIEERCPLEKELMIAEEAFITGSVKEIVPVVRVGDQKIGNGRPGPVAKHLFKLFRANQHRWETEL